MGRRVVGLPVFLSASIPTEDRSPKYFKTADLVAIRDAVRGLASTVLASGSLVFGGHPAISPLILVVAQRLRAVKRVRIYQSEVFRSMVLPASVAFPNTVWTGASDSGLEPSLLRMRTEMLRSTRFAAGVFIGGMEGVEQEFELFKRIHPHSPAFPVGSTGAAAARLLSKADEALGAADRAALRKETAYRSLFRRLLLATQPAKRSRRATRN